MSSLPHARAFAAALVITASNATFAAPAAIAAQSAPTLLRFDIAAGPLGAVLSRYAAAAGVVLSFDAAQLRGLNAAGLHGEYSVQQGFAQILQGSGFQTQVSGGVYTLRPAPQGDVATTLPEVQVTGTALENPVGDVRGYVAHDSITADKTDTPLLDTPQSISVITRDQMRDQGVRSVSGALRYTPGVVAEEFGGADLRVDQYMLRGFSATTPYLDGLGTAGRYTLLSTSVLPYALERVEVLRGPSSVLYGQNVPGGIVALTSKRPTETPLHEIELQGGNWDRKQAAFDFSGPVDQEGKLLYRVTGLALDGGTQVHDVDNKRVYIAPAFTWKPDSDTTFTLLTHYQHQKDGFAGQYLPAEGTLSSGPYGRISSHLFIGEPDFNTFDREEYGVGYAFEHRFNDTWTVRQNLRYTHANVSQEQVIGGGLEPGTPLLDRYTLQSRAWVDDFTVDTQLQAKFNTGAVQHTALVGLDYTKSHDRWVERDGVTSPLNILDPHYGDPIDMPPVDFATDDELRQLGVYAQDQLRWNRWALTAGLRRDWADTTVTDLLADTRTPQDDRKTTGKVGLVYTFDNGLAPYVSYSTSFAPTPGAALDGSPYKPTTGKQYEVGVKYQPTGYDSFMMVSAYDLTQRNMLTADPANPNFLLQTGEVRIRGLELSGVADLTQGWKLVAAYTLMDPTITRSNDGTEGNRPKSIPKQMASVWLDKTVQGGPMRGLGMGAGVRYVGTRYGDDQNTLDVPANTLVDAAIHYEMKHWRFALNAANLFDKVYVGSCNGSDSSCQYGLRRSVMGTVAYRW